MLRLFPILLVPLLICGCKVGEKPIAAKVDKPSVSNKGKEPPRLALSLPGREVVRLGVFRLESKATLKSSVPGYPAQVVEQSLRLDVDEQGAFHARKETHEQQGQEVIFSGGWLHARLRHSKFTRHKPAEGEVGKVLDRMASYLPGYVQLLSRFLKVEQPGEAAYQGRPALKLILSQAAQSSQADEKGGAAGPARRWREEMAVTKLEGKVVLDRQTRLALSVDLKARITFKAPLPRKKVPVSGLPSILSDKLQGTMEITFSRRISQVGKVAPIKPPSAKETITDVRRRRLELERQMLTGEVRIPDDWRKEP